MNTLQHIPVLKDAILRYFANTHGILLDATFGGGGHTAALLNQDPHLQVVALDIDPEAAQRAKAVQAQFPQRFQFFAYNFSELDQLKMNFDGILMDLGVSSFQLDQAERGFSFRNAGPLDMRMNPNVGISAKTFLENASQEELTVAIRDYGEEKQWKSIVKAILSYRNEIVWENTVAFADFLLKHTTLSRSKKPGIHPATRVFQGIRIYVNQELEHLKRGLVKAFNCLNPQGQLAVITFHSLEDRIVKQFFNEKCGKSLNKFDAEPRQFKQITATLATRKPIIADPEEVRLNPRSRSAKLRIIQKIS